MPDGALDGVFIAGFKLAVDAYGDDFDLVQFNDKIRNYSPAEILEKARDFRAETFEEPPTNARQHAERVAAMLISLYNEVIDPTKRVPVGRGRTLAPWNQKQS